MMEAAPKHLFSPDFILRSDASSSLLLDVSCWRERAEFELDGSSYRLYREGFASGAFILEGNGEILARAHKPSALWNRFEVELDGAVYVLRKLSVFRRRFGLFLDDRRVGVIEPTGVLTRRAEIKLPAERPAAIQVFLFWLALLIWNREAAAGAT